MTLTFRQEATKMGYAVHYDRSLGAWVIFKEGRDAEYIPSEIFNTTPEKVLIKTYLN